MSEASREAAEIDGNALAARDRADPLAPFRARFLLPDGIAYLDGNSLGALPATTPAALEEVVRRQWGQDLIASWNRHGWIDLAQAVGGLIAPLIGAAPDEVVAADSTSVNLFKLLAAALTLRPGRGTILAERGSFPTDLYMAQGLAGLVGGAVVLRLVAGGELEAALGPEVAVVMLNHVDYRTGRLHDMARLTRAAHAAGALALWDLAHSAGVLPVDLGGCGVDLAVGCGYKFLNGGPGAPAFLYVARRHQDEARPPLCGWMGHADPFAFEDSYRPAAGIARFLVGTPPVLGLAALAEGVRLVAEAGIGPIRAKSQALSEVFLALARERLVPLGVRLLSPVRAEERGSQVALAHPEAFALIQALIARGVVGDFRAPDVLRFGLAPLYNRFAEIGRAVATLEAVLRQGAHRRPEYQRRGKVT